MVVRQEFRFVRSNVDIDRALALAALAGKAEVEGLAHGLVAPAVLHEFALQHLEQQMRSPPRTVHLLARDLVARAHRPGIGLAQNSPRLRGSAR